MDNRILIAEDEPNLRRLVASYLLREGYQVTEAANGQEALDRFEENPDVVLVILDLMMPVLDGCEACRRLRQISEVPILMLTARSGEEDEMQGFRLGADEYVSKPFSPAILMARVKNLLRRSGRGILTDLKFGGLEILYHQRQVLVNGVPVVMTPREFDLLYCLCINRNVVLSRETLLSRVWGMDYTGDDRTVDTHIKCLRAKLGDYGSSIITVRKVGYKFEPKKEPVHQA